MLANRGTQTDLVTDRNITECLVELRSRAEFQDLSYRLGRSCTGEVTLTVTRDSLMGLLGVPFDPISVIVTASGACYRNVLFTPFKVFNLKDRPNGNFNLREFRNELWKLSGRAGFGFCPGFKESDFPDDFQFEAHGLVVLHQPFVRIQSPECMVFVQQRRSSSRAVSQPLQLKLCTSCFETLTNIFVTFKSLKRDLTVVAFAKFLPFNSSSRADASARPIELNSKVKLGKDFNNVLPASVGKVAAAEDSSVVENADEVRDTAGRQNAEDDRPVGRSGQSGKDRQNKAALRGCSVLLDRVMPHAHSDHRSVSPSQSSSGIVTSLNSKTFPSSSMSGRTMLTSISQAAATTSIGRPLMQTHTDSSSSRPVLSARVKPFRAEMPHEEEALDTMVPEGGVTDMADIVITEVQSQHSQQTEKLEASPEAGPPVLTPEVLLSPDSSPRPLLIDEEMELEQQEMDTGEPESKQPCLRCGTCQEAFPSESQLQQHVFSHHQTVADTPSTPTVHVDSEAASEGSGQSRESEQSACTKTCPICHQAFGSKEELERHLISRHGARLHPCRYCGQKFALKKNLADHLQRHRGTGTLTCQECGQKFKRKKHFAAHVREHMGSLPYFCTICSRMFSREKVYEEHMARHRAGRGVHAVLGGSDKTRQGIMSKAKKCLEEKALLTTPASPMALDQLAECSDLLSSNTASTSVPPPKVTFSHLIQSSTSLPVASLSIASPSSNLHLLSAVSLAQAEYDQQPDQERAAPVSAGSCLPSTHSVGLNQVSTINSGSVEGSIRSKDSQEASAVHIEESSDPVVLLERLGAPLKASKCPSTVPSRQHSVEHPDLNMKNKLSPGGSGSQRTEENHSFENTYHSPGSDGSPVLSTMARQSTDSDVGDALLSHTQQTASTSKVTCRNQTADHTREISKRENTASTSDMTDTEYTTDSGAHSQKTTKIEEGPECSAGEQELRGREERKELSDKERQFKEREEKLLRKEEELKERERVITRKNMLFFQQLLMARMVPNPKTASNSAQSKGDKPSPQQAMAMFAALNSMAGRGIGRGAVPFRPPVPSAGKVPTNVTGVPVTAGRGGGQREQTVGAGGQGAATSQSVVLNPSGNPLLSAPVPSPRTGAQSTSKTQHSLHPHPSLSGQASTLSAPTSSKDGPPQGSSFLQELMTLESKMSSSAKAFLPPSLPKAASGRSAPHRPVNHRYSSSIISPGQSASTHKQEKEQGVAGGAGDGRKIGGGPSSSQGLGGTARGNRGAWSGGVVKEKMSNIVSIVPPQEMQRLLSLSKPRSPLLRLPQHSPSCSPQLPSSGSPCTASPSLTRSVPAALSAASSLSAASPMSQAQATPSAPVSVTCTAANSIVVAVSAGTSQVTTSPGTGQKSNVEDLPPMPQLIPASVIDCTTTSRLPLSHDRSPAKDKAASEDVGPIDLTKGGGNKVSKPATRSSKVTHSSDRTGSPSTDKDSAASQTIVLPLVPLQSAVSPQHGAQSNTVPINNPGPSGAGGEGGRGMGVAMVQGTSAVHNQGELLSQIGHEEKMLKSEGLALMQHFLPALVAQQAAGQREALDERLAVPPFPSSPLLRMMRGSPQAVGSVQGSSVVGRLVGPLRLSLRSVAPPIRPGGHCLLPPASAVVTLTSNVAGMSPASVSATPSVSTSSDGAASVSGAAKSVPASPVPLSSPDASTSLSSQSVAGSAHSKVSSVQAMSDLESSGAGDQQKCQGSMETVQQTPNPLGGFLWHKPAVDTHNTAHPHLPPGTHKRSAKRQSGEGGEEREDNTIIGEGEGGRDISDHNLWQQQFLATLRAKRRQKQEQEQRQQQEAHQHVMASAQHSHTHRPGPGQQEGQAKKRALMTSETKTHPSLSQHSLTSPLTSSPSPSGALANPMSPASQGTQPLAPSSAAGDSGENGSPGAAQSTSKSGGRVGHGRQRGKPKKRAESARSSSREVEEGVDLSHQKQAEKDGELGIEGGVRCRDCGHMFFSESDILQHDCDAMDT